MKKILFLNDDEEKDVNNWVNDMIQQNDQVDDFVSSGGLHVKLEVKPENKGDKYLFSIYRQIGEVEVVKK